LPEQKIQLQSNLSGANENMGEYSLGYQEHEIIRQNAGSPGTWSVFTSVMEAVAIDNTGSPGVYFNFKGTATDTGSTSGFVPDDSAIAFAVRVGSINIYAPTGSPSVQVIGLRS